MANASSQKPHAIFVPYPLQGHVIPSVHLAFKLASKGFTIIFVNTHFVHHQTSKAHPDTGSDIFDRVRGSGLDVRYTTVSDGLPLGFVRSLNHDQFFASLLHEPALVFTLYYHLILLGKNGHLGLDHREDTINYIRGVETIEPKDVMSYLKLIQHRSFIKYRKKVKEMRKTLENALTSNGSSERNMNIFIKELKAKSQTKFINCID